MIYGVAPLKIIFPVRPIRSKKMTRSLQVKCAPTDIAKKIATDSTEIILKPVIDVLKSIDNRLGEINKKLDTIVKHNLQIVDTETIKK
jgi:hypothetical protein